MISTENHIHTPPKCVEIRRFRPKIICIYLQNLSKSDDFEGFEVEDIPTEPPLDQAKAFDKVTRVSWGADVEYLAGVQGLG